MRNDSGGRGALAKLLEKFAKSEVFVGVALTVQDAQDPSSFGNNFFQWLRLAGVWGEPPYESHFSFRFAPKYTNVFRVVRYVGRNVVMIKPLHPA